MAEQEKPHFETIGIDAFKDSQERPGAPRKNIPIIMQLQGQDVGKKHVLQKPEIVIGRSPDCDIPLADYETSRRHAAIAYENIDRPDEMPRCMIRDLDSKNGTIVNGEKISSRELRDKDTISIGSAVLGYYLKDEVEIEFDAELYSMATIDSLTGVFNKQYFQREYNSELQRSERGQSPLSLLFCDLDHFKQVNDTHGHLAGDFILRKIGEILLSSMREYDICARYGGEEFAVLLPGTSIDEAANVAKRLREQVESYVFDYQGTVIKQTVSVGVATLLPDMRDTNDLIQAADMALYKAKSGGRNKVVCAGVE